MVPVRFDEENSPAAVWGLSGLSIALSLLVGILEYLHLAPYTPALRNTTSGLFKFAELTNELFLFGSFLATMYVFMGAIWHPIPGGYQGGITSLHINTEESPSVSATQNDFKLCDLDSETTEDDDPLVNSSDIEMRDNIQWVKILQTGACVVIAIALCWFVYH